MKRTLLLAVAIAFVVVFAGGAGPCDVFLGNAECAKDSDCHANRLCTDDGRCVECIHDRDCDNGEVCGSDNTCERGSGGEGEGTHGGEGEGTHAGEGEGANAGEGEGEGAPHPCSTACDCNVGQACVQNQCSAPSGICSTDADCPRESSASGTCTIATCGGFFCNTQTTGEGEGEGAAGEGEGEGACDVQTVELQCLLSGQSFDQASCSCVPTQPAGEGEGEGAPDTCANHIGKNTSTATDGCDCGCGVHDPDCGTGGCDAPGCATNTVVTGCNFCWDGNATAQNCASAGQ
jgi:hypothetical protein